MSDERKFPWVIDITNGSTRGSQAQREMSPQSSDMDVEHDFDEQDGGVNPPLGLLSFASSIHVAAAAHAMGISTPSNIDSDNDDAMDIDEDEVPSPSPGLVNHPSSNNEASTSNIPSLEQYMARSFEEKPSASNRDVFSEHSSEYASSGQNTPSRIKRDSRSPASPVDYPLDEPIWFDVLDPNSARDVSRPPSLTDNDDGISVGSIDNDQSPLHIWRTLLCQLGPHEKDEEDLIEFVKAPLGECPDDE